jgi:hypothetical protein
LPSNPFGEVRDLPISSLNLDPRNPRFHPPVAGEISQHDLARRLAEEDDAIVIARSIARHGFYPWEVLVVVDHDGDLTVVEGNRRLTALRGLTDGDLRRSLAEAPEWEELAQKASEKLDGTAPCVIAESRGAAQPALGYRHISGIAPWGPFAQARFIAHLIEEEEKSESEVAEVTGKTPPWVRQVYRNYRVTKQAEKWDLDTDGIVDSFSLMDVALSQKGVKEFVGIGASTQVVAGSEPVPSDMKDNLAELISFVWGDAEHEPVITDSRQIKKLGRIITNPSGLDSLREGKSLDEASVDAATSEFDPIESLVGKIQAAAKAASTANRESRTLSDEHLLDDRVASAIEGFQEEASQLLQGIDNS